MVVGIEKIEEIDTLTSSVTVLRQLCNRLKRIDNKKIEEIDNKKIEEIDNKEIDNEM
ncbi:MAG: hypothetical protein Q8R96_00490 [Bacteroidota bacterium]|nr:hypothetical protein [Bacteroidota bacterium]